MNRKLPVPSVPHAGGRQLPPSTSSRRPSLHRREGSHAPAFLRPSSSNPVAEVSQEALELGMLAGDQALELGMLAGDQALELGMLAGDQALKLGMLTSDLAPPAFHPDSVGPDRVIQSTGSYLGRLNASGKQRDCSVCECPDKEFPKPFKKPYSGLSSENMICQEGKPEATTLDTKVFKGWVETNNPWTTDDETDIAEMTYVNLQLNHERLTGYTGDSARRIWDSIYKEN